MSVLVYIVVLMSLVGWFFFSIFGGVGLFSLPYDWINDFLHRPKKINKDQYLINKKVIGEQAGLLMESGDQVKLDMKGMPKTNGLTRASRGLKKREKEFKRDVLILEYHYRRLEDAYKNQGGNIIVHYAKLCGGIIGYVVFPPSLESLI